MIGYSRSDLTEKKIDWRKITPDEFRPRDAQAVEELALHGRCEPYEKAVTHKDGHLVPIYVGASLLDNDQEQGVAFIMDLSERKKSKEQLKLAATVFAASNDGILITDPAMRIVSANRALCGMTGYDEEELKGKTPKILQSGYTTAKQYQDMRHSLQENGHWQGDIVDRMKNGTLLPVRASISAVKDAAGQISHYVAILSDISERKAEEEQLRHLAHHDTLTGLPNRVLFNDRITQAIKHAARHRRRFAVLFFDLNDFKPVNDRYGHEVGDKLLQEVAARLSMNVRGADTVTRLGGDEFVILLDEISDRQSVDNVLKKTVDSICAPCRIDGHDITIGVSAGVSIYPDDGIDAPSLVHHADTAMYRSKKNKGRSREG
ncbi:sensor domain-containing diguanylate cyclase [Methylogaea oryzae]|nr:sensor domain-containing diguanylate cyclase [Methylogaea oryzae]